MAHIWYTMREGSHEAFRKDQEMPRRKLNPYPVGSAEFIEEEDRRAQEPVATERNLTITVSLEAINSAKALSALSGMPYRALLGSAASQGVEALTASVRKVLAGDDGTGQDMPF